MKNSIKIASFNVQSFRKHPERRIIDREFAASVTRKYMPDILGLNEVSCGPAYGKQPEDFAETAGYKHSFFAPVLDFGDRTYGNALVSNYPITSAEVIGIEDPVVKDEDAYYETRCILKANIDVLGGITVYVSHFGLAESERTNAVRKITELISDKPQRTVLMGDFNMLPDDKKLIPIKNLFRDTSDGYNLEEFKTYPSDSPYMKIDYIFASSDFKVINSYVAPEIGSDHRMILTELSLEDAL